MLLLNITREAYMESPLVLLHTCMTLVTLEGESQGHTDFEGLYLVKDPN